ncbi:MAG: putative zinc-binding peptidase [Conexibacteraceae bacterium]|nr:putative zinc-binding peptidase [Conexibacteraceae bacterium]
MQALRCPRCGEFTPFETLSCGGCGQELGFHLPTLAMVAATADGTVVDGARWVPCVNRAWQCNWMVAEDDERAFCFSCRLTRRRPPADDTLALERLAETAAAKRRLLFQLTRLSLPIEPWDEVDGGLGFDLLSSLSEGKPIITGHANGIITIDLVESLDAQREALRVQLDEPYRTMLGHFRHEVGHYYEWVLVEQGPWIEECRALFGDERASYADALARHYKLGAPDNWAESFISEYATMHPWEDFAECFAHYLHITDTLDTIAISGMVLHADRVEGAIPHDITPRRSYADATIEEVLEDWRWVSLLLNRANHAMGKGDLYPFTIASPVKRKLGFVHRVVRSAGADGTSEQLS